MNSLVTTPLDQRPSHPGLADVEARIMAAEQRAGRPTGSVSLVAVTKIVDVDAIVPIIEAGHRVFGENRVQEAEAKWPALREQFPDIELHCIGPLQTNKAAKAVELFDCIQTVDRPKLAKMLARQIQAQGRSPALFVQVNTGKEPQKAGVAPELADQFIEACRSEYGLDIQGAMCIPPFEDKPAPHFELLEEIARRNGLQSVSMGMSADFEVAVELGATHVRVGHAILGERESL